MKLSEHTQIYFRKNSLKDTRNAEHLLVWAELGQWMLVDDELLEFLGVFGNKPQTIKDILADYAAIVGRTPDLVKQEVMPVIEELLRRGILSTEKELTETQADKVQIANVTINITNACNLQCSWCYNSARAGSTMPIDKIMGALEGQSDFYSPDASLIILGGEPMMDMERLLYAIGKGNKIFKPKVLVSTNGTFLTGENVAKLKSRNVEIQVSLDGSSARVHDAVRGEGVFAKATEGIRRLLDADIYSVISMVYTSDTITEFEPYLELAKQLGVQEARFIPLRQIGRGLEYSSALPNQLKAFRSLNEILGRRPELHHLLKRDFFTISAHTCGASSQRNGCGIGRRVVFIDADGIVYPCPNHVAPEFVCGSLYQEPLSNIVRNSTVMETLRKRYRLQEYKTCRVCPYGPWCAGDCRGEVLASTGEPLTPSGHCAEYKGMYKEMLWLIAKGDRRWTRPDSTNSDNQLIC